jgi:hypothetical protein
MDTAVDQQASNRRMKGSGSRAGSPIPITRGLADQLECFAVAGQVPGNSTTEGMNSASTVQASSALLGAARIWCEATLLPAKRYDAAESGAAEPDLGE